MAASRLLDLFSRFFGVRPGYALPQMVAAHDVSPRQFSHTGVGDAAGSPWTEERAYRMYEYDGMDAGSSDISVALDIYAEEATQRSPERQRTIWFSSDDPKVNEALEDMHHAVEGEDLAFGMHRSLSKYGELFCFPLAGARADGDNRGVYKLLFFHPSVVEVALDPETGQVSGYTCDALDVLESPTSATAMDRGSVPSVVVARKEEGFAPWDFIHFKIPGSDLQSGYGVSMIESVRRTWQTLAMLETSVALHRLLRAGSKLLWKLDMGRLPPDQQVTTMERWIQATRRQQQLQVRDPASGGPPPAQGTLGSYLERNNIDPHTMQKDLYMPVAENSKSDVTLLTVPADISALEDVELYIRHVRTGLGIPKAYFEQDISGWQADKALSQQDVRFAKKVERLQRSFINGYADVCAIHLFYRGFTKFSFTVHMRPPSALLHLQMLAVMNQQIAAANSLLALTSQVGFNPVRWSNHVLREIMQLSDEQITYFREGGTPPQVGMPGGLGGPPAPPPPNDLTPDLDAASPQPGGPGDTTPPGGGVLGTKPSDYAYAAQRDNKDYRFKSIVEQLRGGTFKKSQPARIDRDALLNPHAPRPTK